MAFGKNPAELTKVGSFRQTGHTWNQARNERKSKPQGGGRTPSWVNEYRPPTDDVDLIRVIQGNYTVEDTDAQGALVHVPGLPFWPYIEHYDSRSKRRSICSAGPFANDRNKKQPCHGCDLFWSSMKVDQTSGRKVKGFMGKRDMVSFTIIDYSPYHKVEQIDANGAVRMNENTNQPYFTWTKCKKNSEGRGVCDPCDAKKETRVGHRLHWPMGSDHYNTLLNYDATVGKSCTTCGTQETIRNDAWLCANPNCGEAIIDGQTRMSNKEIDELVNHPVKCKHCGNEGFLVELISCINCTPAGKAPKRATIFDVDLKVRRVEPEDGSNRTSLSIVGFVGPRAIPKQFVEIAKPEQLNQIYAPTPLEVQATLFQVTAMSQPTRDPVTASRPYGGSGPNYG